MARFSWLIHSTQTAAWLVDVQLHYQELPFGSHSESALEIIPRKEAVFDMYFPLALNTMNKTTHTCCTQLVAEN